MISYEFKHASKTEKVFNIQKHLCSGVTKVISDLDILTVMLQYSDRSISVGESLLCFSSFQLFLLAIHLKLNFKVISHILKNIPTKSTPLIKHTNKIQIIVSSYK